MASRIIGYTRVSTQEQAREGVSLDAQTSVIESYCKMRGFELAEIVSDEGVSAYKKLRSRAGGLRVLEALKSEEVQGVVALRLDRMFRDAIDCLTCTRIWDKSGKTLHLIDMGGTSIDTSTAMGRFFLTINAAHAEMERNLIGERTREAMQLKRRRGEFCGGGVPYGFAVKDDGSLDCHREESKAVEIMQTLYSQKMSFAKISRELAKLEIFSRTGKPFHHEQIKRIVAARDITKGETMKRPTNEGVTMQIAEYQKIVRDWPDPITSNQDPAFAKSEFKILRLHAELAECIAQWKDTGELNLTSVSSSLANLLHILMLRDIAIGFPWDVQAESPSWNFDEVVIPRDSADTYEWYSMIKDARNIRWWCRLVRSFGLDPAEIASLSVSLAQTDNAH